jgi:hypothetical protein
VGALGFPHRLRYRLAYDHRLCRIVLGVFVRAFRSAYRRQAKRQGLAGDETGMVRSPHVVVPARAVVDRLAPAPRGPPFKPAELGQPSQLITHRDDGTKFVDREAAHGFGDRRKVLRIRRLARHELDREREPAYARRIRSLC